MDSLLYSSQGKVSEFVHSPSSVLNCIYIHMLDAERMTFTGFAITV